jgi:hypothetical protein
VRIAAREELPKVRAILTHFTSDDALAAFLLLELLLIALLLVGGTVEAVQRRRSR